MRRLITQRDNRVRAESFRQQLDELQASEAAALREVRRGEDGRHQRAIEMAPQPPQLLLKYAKARVAERLAPAPDVDDESDEELRSATLRRQLATARLATAAAELAATEAEIDKREAMLRKKRVRRV
jgi:hypothetical protein